MNVSKKVFLGFPLPQVHELTLVPLEFAPQQLGGKKIKMAAHQSDVLRVEILLREGGIYLDWDVLVVNSFDNLLHNNVVLGMEKVVPEYREVMGVAAILSRPGEPFLERWQKQMGDAFKEDCCTAVAASVSSASLWTACRS